MGSRNAFVKLCKYLQDSNLVYAFQKHFGVERVDCPVKVTNGTTPISSYDGSRRRARSPPEVHEEVDKKPGFVIKSLFWYYVFSFGTSLGYELFYASFFSFWVWNLNLAVCRRVVNVWVFVMYIGQALKDIICWPRPSSPPVVPMEPKYVQEFGMPSTHAMVSVALPFSFLYFCYPRYQFSLYFGLLIAVVWCSLVCCSRLYMGMHTILDIIGGLVLSPLLMLIYLPLADVVDQFQMKSTYSPCVTVSLMVILQILYPKGKAYTPARGDTSVIMGTATGFAIGTWVNFRLGLLEGSSFLPPPAQIMWPGYRSIGVSILRMAIGLVCVAFARTIFKPGLYKAVCYTMGLNPSSSRCKQIARVEMPYKYLTYIIIGFVIVSIVPQVFIFLNVERMSVYVEN